MSNKDDVLDKILGGVPGRAAKIRKGTSGINAALQKQGLRHKAMAEDVGGKLDELKSMLSDDPQMGADLLQWFLSQHGGADGEPDGDEGDLGEEDMEMDDEYMEMDDGEEETKAADEDEDEPDPTVAGRKARKDQPGYTPPAKAGLPQQSLVNQAITKRPGSFPKPVPPQVQTGVPPKKSRGKSLGESDLVRALKSLDDKLSDVEAALGELADIPERLEALEETRSLRPRQASMDESTAVSDKQLISGIKKQMKIAGAQVDQFWGASVAPREREE